MVNMSVEVDRWKLGEGLERVLESSSLDSESRLGNAMATDHV